MPYRGSVIPSASELGDGWNALVGTLKGKKEQPNMGTAWDAMKGTIKSKVSEIHPIDSFESSLEWLYKNAQPAIEDYSQLKEGYPNATKFANALGQNISQHIPSTQDFQSPQAMSQWSQAAALNAPMALGAGAGAGALAERGSMGRGSYSMPQGQPNMGMGANGMGPTYGADFKDVYGGNFKTPDEVRNRLAMLLQRK